MEYYTGHKVLITGASSGIGRAAAIVLSELGNTVVLCARHMEGLQETRSLMAEPDRHICIAYDVCDFQHYNKLFDTIIQDGVKLDGFVHSAGVAEPVPLRIMNRDVINRTMDVNYNAFVCLTSMYAKKKYSNGGSIVGISANNAHYPQKCMGIYAGSKAALEASVKTFAIELVKQNIRINCVIPGAIKTPMTDKVDKDFKTSYVKEQLLGMGSPEDVAKVILFLLSEQSGFITGRSIYVDGGFFGQMK